MSSNLFFLPKVPLLPWVRLHYQPSFSLDQTVDIFEKDTRKEVSLVFHSTLLKYHQISINVQSVLTKQVGNDTVEGIAFSKDTAVIMTGVFVEEDEVGGGHGGIVGGDG